MSKTFKEIIRDRDNLINEIISQIEKKIKTFPEGGLSIKRISNKVYFYLNGTAEGERLLKADEKQLIADLVQKRYLKKVLKASKKEADALRRFEKNYPSLAAEDIYDQLSKDMKKYAKRIGLADEQYVRKWENKSYTPKPFKDGYPVYLTMKGERVRSKSEVIIADRLYANGIPYKYECPLIIGSEVIRPDFSILRVSDRKVVYLEHCGKADDPEYQEEMVPRINKYILAGIYEGEKLFLTFEADGTPLDVRVLDVMINRHFK
jgi:hypothetical protein